MKKITLLVTLFLSVTALGAKNQVLQKNGGEYLGSVVSSALFQTCHGGRLAIKPGSVVETDDKCSSSIVGPITGNAKLQGNTLVVTDSHANQIEFTLDEAEVKVARQISGTIRVSLKNGHRVIEENR